MSARYVLSIGIAALVCVGLPRGGGAQAAGIAVGLRAPNAAVETLEGHATELAHFVGTKPVLMEFWATWCPLCKQLEPAMRAARDKYAGRVTFVNVGIMPNQTPEKQRKYATDQGIAGEFVFDRFDKAVSAYHVPNPSFIVIIDRTGTVVYTGVGGTQPVDSVLARVAGK
jgi:thiol-disulfide isomerase/thioredoxin